MQGLALVKLAAPKMQPQYTLLHIGAILGSLGAALGAEGYAGEGCDDTTLLANVNRMQKVTHGGLDFPLCSARVITPGQSGRGHR